MPQKHKQKSFRKKSQKSDLTLDSSFYQMLYTNNEFAMAIGRLTMSFAKLESNIKAFIEAKGQKASQKATLGALVKAITENNQIDHTATE